MSPEDYSELVSELNDKRVAHECRPHMEVIDAHVAGKAAIAIQVLLAKLAEAQFIASEMQGKNKLLQAEALRLSAAHEKAFELARKAEDLVSKHLEGKGPKHG